MNPVENLKDLIIYQSQNNEPGCRILEAIEKGELQKERFQEKKSVN
mgnify:CR=1 FL=1